MKGEPKVHNASTYSNWMCRCEICTADHWARIAAARAKRRRQVASGGLPATVDHGASAYINWGCRCDICKAAHAADARAKRGTGAVQSAASKGVPSSDSWLATWRMYLNEKVPRTW